MRPYSRRILGSLAVALAALGCGRADLPHRGRIHGKVTLDGKPLAAGNVRFIALEHGGLNVLAPVANGGYDVPEGRGLVKGKYRVEFSVPKDGRRIPNPDFPGQWTVERLESLPARYHRESTSVLDYDPAD